MCTSGPLSHITTLSTIVDVQLNLVTIDAEFETHWVGFSNYILFQYHMLHVTTKTFTHPLPVLLSWLVYIYIVSLKIKTEIALCGVLFVSLEFFIPHLLYSPFFSLPRSRNADPRSHSRLFSPLPTTVSALDFYREKISDFLFSSTRVECAYPP